MKSGITRSHEEKPSQSTCVKHHITRSNHGASTAPSKACITASSLTRQKRSKPRNTSSDSKRCR